MSRVSLERVDKLAVIRDVWEEWVEIAPSLSNPGPRVTEECLVPFKGRWLPSMASKHVQLCLEHASIRWKECSCHDPQMILDHSTAACWP